MIRRCSQVIHTLLSTLLLHLLLCCNFNHLALGAYLTTPTLLWTHQIQGGGSLHGGRNVRQGNAVVLSPDGSRILVTADDGTLHIFDPAAFSNSTFFEPPISPGTYREGRSGVAWVMQNTSSSVVEYAVYAVIDTPEQVGIAYVDTSGEVVNTTTTPSADSLFSRVVAVDLTGKFLWDVSLPGFVAGTPVVSTDQEKIYASHNYDTGSGEIQGYISIISKSGQLLGTVFDSRVAPFGPPAIQSISGSHDMIIVAESLDDGYGLGQGQIRLLVPSDQYDTLNGQGNASYQWQLFSDWHLPAVARPLVKDSLIWMAGQGAKLAGWTNSTSLLTASTGILSGSGINFTWQTSLQPSERNATQPLGSTPAVSSDLTRLYLNGASIDFVCVDATTGKMLWNDTSGFSLHTAEPKLSEITGQNAVVYAVETLTGTVKQFDASTGHLNWAMGCDQITNIENCANAVEAEFSLSSDGNQLYFGDIFGNIYALQVANFATLAPTVVQTPAPSLAAPSKAPISTTSSPTVAPVSSPTLSPISTTPNPSAGPQASPVAAPTLSPPASSSNLTAAQSTNQAASTQSQSSQSSLPAILGSVVSVLALLALLAGLLLFRSRRRRMAKMAVEREEKEERWRRQRAEYEEECRRDEEEEILEIVAATTVLPAAGMIMTTPTKEKRRRGRKNKKAKSLNAPLTPSTLSSIEETPDEIDSIGSDRRGRPQRGMRSRSLDRLLAKLMGVKTDRPPIRNLETAFENAAEEEIVANPATKEQPVEILEQIEHIQQEGIEKDLLMDTDEVQAMPKLSKGKRSRSVGPGYESAHLETVDQKPPRGRRSQSLERILGRLTGMKQIRAEDKASAAPSVSEAPSTPVRANTMTSIMIDATSKSGVETMEEGDESDQEGRLTPVPECETHNERVEAKETESKSPNIYHAGQPIARSPGVSKHENFPYSSRYVVDPIRAKSPLMDEIDQTSSLPISPIPSVGSSSQGRGRPTLNSSRGPSMSPTNSFRSSSSYSIDAYSLPGEDHSISTGSGVTEEQLMIRRRDLDKRRNYELVRPSPSTSNDDRFAQTGGSPPTVQSPIELNRNFHSMRNKESGRSEQSSSISASWATLVPSSSVTRFPHLPGQNKVLTPEDLISVDSSLYLEDSRSRSGSNAEQPGSLLVNASSPRLPTASSDAIFPQLPGQKQAPTSADLISLGSSLYLDDNSVSLSAITFEREKEEASVLSEASPIVSRPVEQDLQRPKLTLDPPEGVDYIKEDTTPPGAHYVRRPQPPGQTSQEIERSKVENEPNHRQNAHLPDIDITASVTRYNRSLRNPATASRIRDVKNEQSSQRLRNSMIAHQHALLDAERAERRSHSVADRRRSTGTHESAEGHASGYSDPNDELRNLRTRNSVLDGQQSSTIMERPQRGVSSGAETRLSTSETSATPSGEGSDFAVAETPERSRRNVSTPPKSDVVADSWSKFLKDLAKAERAFFYPDMDVEPPTAERESQDDESEGDVTPPPPPPPSSPPPVPPLLPRPVGEDTRRRLV